MVCHIAVLRRAADGAGRGQIRLEEHAKRPERQAAIPEAQHTTQQQEETKSWWVELTEKGERERDPLKAKVREALEVNGIEQQSLDHSPGVGA